MIGFGRLSLYWRKFPCFTSLRHVQNQDDNRGAYLTISSVNAGLLSPERTASCRDSGLCSDRTREECGENMNFEPAKDFDWDTEKLRLALNAH